MLVAHAERRRWRDDGSEAGPYLIREEMLYVGPTSGGGFVNSSYRIVDCDARIFVEMPDDI